MENVPSIVPILSKEFRTITIKLRQTLQDLGCVPHICRDLHPKEILITFQQMRDMKEGV